MPLIAKMIAIASTLHTSICNQTSPWCGILHDLYARSKSKSLSQFNVCKFGTIWAILSSRKKKINWIFTEKVELWTIKHSNKDN